MSNIKYIGTKVAGRNEKVIIGFKNKPEPPDIDFVISLGGRINIVFAIINAIAAIVPENEIDKIKRNPNVKYVEIDEGAEILEKI